MDTAYPGKRDGKISLNSGSASELTRKMNN
jgi:hypothetical protein